MNVLDDFYLPLLDQEKTYLSKEYKLLKANKIDTAEFEGFEKDKNAGEVQFTEATEDNKISGKAGPVINAIGSNTTKVEKNFVV